MRGKNKGFHFLDLSGFYADMTLQPCALDGHEYSTAVKLVWQGIH